MTWNIKRNPEIWDYVQKSINPDICLFQEYSENVDTERPKDIEIIHRAVEGKPWYWDAILATRGLPITNLDFEKYSGRILIAEIRTKRGKLCIVNIHAQEIGGDYTEWTEKVLDEIEPIIFANKDNLILGGDLNMGLLYDKLDGTTSNKELIERIQAYGLKMYPETEQQTYRRDYKLEPKYPDDYFFVSKRLDASKFQILYDEKIGELSDHNPLIFDIPND